MVVLEEPAGAREEHRLLLAHPALVSHIAAIAMQLPVSPDREVVWKDLSGYKNKAIFPKISIDGTVIDIVDQIVIKFRPLFDQASERNDIANLLEPVTAMRAGRPDQDCERQSRHDLRKRTRKIAIALETKRLRNPTRRYPAEHLAG